MSFSISDRLLRREIADPYRAQIAFKRKSGHNASTSKPHSYTHIRGFYGDKVWVNDLDIINELGGHTGCVNALSWSKSGRLLASGSDDTHLNIHAYQPEDSSRPFSLATTISTGHTANIFSVKFMPHSNDSTLISCAGDDQVRVFDIEHNGQPAGQGHIVPSSARHHSGVNLEELYRGVQYLTPGTTNGRVYRSHSDRVKRIITESSPHLFLTCSEDGEVRQWDLRLPSSAYPAPRRDGSQRVPPPLISYKRFQLDLNTISCSGSQPHYIVLGGTHLHAFLHDRRMLGRDLSRERGSPSQRPASAAGDEAMAKATKCVRRFAPNGKSKMKRTDSGHITACKISDAYPNEMIASWSGDHIYSFDLVASPDAADVTEEESKTVSAPSPSKSRASPDKKRKRERRTDQPLSISSAEALARGTPRARSSSIDEPSNVALRVRYGNGQSEDIPLLDSHTALQQATESMITESQKRCLRIAKSVTRIRKLIFQDQISRDELGSVYPAQRLPNRRPHDNILAMISSILPEMEELTSAWSYPMSPSSETVARQQKMRSNRAAACTFVQACGVFARMMGGVVMTTDPVETRENMRRFSAVDPPPQVCSDWQKFCFTLLAAVIAWLQGGNERLIQSFKDPSRGRFFIPEDAGVDAIKGKIIPHLSSLASASGAQWGIVDVEANRFESDETRVLFRTGNAAVEAFSNAIDELTPRPSSNLETAQKQSASSSAQHEQLANNPQRDLVTRKFWKLKAVRGILLAAGKDLRFIDVNQAFGGPNVRSELNEDHSQDDVDLEEQEEPVQQVSLVESTGPAGNGAPDLPPAYEEIIAADDLHAALRNHGITVTMSGSEGEADGGSPEQEHSIDGDSDETDIDDLITGPYPPGTALPRSVLEEFQAQGVDVSMYQELGSENGDGDEDPNWFLEHEEYGEEDDEEEDEDDDGDGFTDDDELEYEVEDDDGQDESEDEMDPRTLFSTAGSYGRAKETVEADVPCSSHTRVYQGHCNVRTVKDVNFYGLEDEYVVSGSDSGHVFIWDRKTGKLLNVLQGDGEVVNVIQGHPFEPMLAVSGIDHTIKIFSPDSRAQAAARHGVDLGTSTHRSHGVSRLMMSSRMRQRLDPLHADRESRSPSGQHTPNSLDPAADAAATMAAWLDDDGDDPLDSERPTNGGLATCKRMKDSYQIISRNDADRQGGMEDAVMTRSFLAQLAAHIHARRAAAAAAGGHAAAAGGAPGDEGEPEGEEQTVVIGDDCTIM